MSNRGRQNVASFLALDMSHDWRQGADWFESQLTDYDVHSNWGNWVSAAGMTGGRINKFNVVKQSKVQDRSYRWTSARCASHHLQEQCRSKLACHSDRPYTHTNEVAAFLPGDIHIYKLA